MARIVEWFVVVSDRAIESYGAHGHILNQEAILAAGLMVSTSIIVASVIRSVVEVFVRGVRRKKD
jgi:hypothetical protein